MNNKPKVSIIMGAYNCEKTLDACVNSMLAQTFTDWEFVICDDHSTDHTLKKLKEIAATDVRIKVLANEKNSKLPFTLNRCLGALTGEYIARMDADDLAFPDRLAKQVSYLDSHPEIAVVGSALLPFDEEKDFSVRYPSAYPTSKTLLLDVPFYHPTIMMRKSVYDDLKGYTVSKRTIKGQDLDLWFRFYEKGYQGYNIQEPLLKYHESLNDYKKRDIVSAWRMTQTKLLGFKRNKMKIYHYPFALKPVVSAIIPKKIKHTLSKK